MRAGVSPVCGSARGVRFRPGSLDASFRACVLDNVVVTKVGKNYAWKISGEISMRGAKIQISTYPKYYALDDTLLNRYHSVLC